MKTVEKGEGLVEDLHAYLRAEKGTLSAAVSVCIVEVREASQGCMFVDSQSMSTPSPSRVSRRFVRPRPWPM